VFARNYADLRLPTRPRHSGATGRGGEKCRPRSMHRCIFRPTRWASPRQGVSSSRDTGIRIGPLPQGKGPYLQQGVLQQCLGRHVFRPHC
jgi:hypothetical protein